MEHLLDIVNNMPEKPGCYQYFDLSGNILYVGKAKNLKRRVLSYFNKEQTSRKTAVLVNQIRDIKYFVVKTEEDALLLENNLIKKHKPKYNILLKDDKTYPSLKITSEEYPRVVKTREKWDNSAQYFGPYSNVKTLNNLLKLLKQIYKTRSCRQNINSEGINKGKYKECLEYHMENCLAPCVGRESANDYNKQIEEIRELLSGNIGKLGSSMSKAIKEYSGKLEFEKAMTVKERLDALNSFKEKSLVVSKKIDNVDVFTIEKDDNLLFINYLHISEGSINQAVTFEFKNKLEESLREILPSLAVEIRAKYKSRAKEIVAQFKPEVSLGNIKWTVPQRGEKKRLLDLSSLNAKQYKIDRRKREDKLNPEQKRIKLLKEIQNLVQLPSIPFRIECFDNSHTSGSNAVAAAVIYINGKPSKKEYRLYIIKTEKGGDDYGSMREILTRRYKRVVEEQSELPDLVVVDGGKGQMEIAREVAKELNIKLNILGLKKNIHHKTAAVLYGFPQKEVGIRPDSEVFRFFEQMQEEVHRFAINFHKKKRSASQIQSELSDIKGIGHKSAELLLNKFKSVKRITLARQEEIEECIGKSKAAIIKEWIRNNYNKDI